MARMKDFQIVIDNPLAFRPKAKQSCHQVPKSPESWVGVIDNFAFLCQSDFAGVGIDFPNIEVTPRVVRPSEEKGVVIPPAVPLVSFDLVGPAFASRGVMDGEDCSSTEEEMFGKF